MYRFLGTKRLFLFFFISYISTVGCLAGTNPGAELWYTGPLLILAPVNMESGQFAIETVANYSNTYAIYQDNWKTESISSISSIQPVVQLKVGFPWETEIKLIGSFNSNFQSGKTATNVNDSYLFLGKKLFDQKNTHSAQNLSVFIQTILPSGKYDRLSSDKALIQETGAGAYQFGPSIAYQNTWYLKQGAFILYANAIYFYPTRVSLHGLSTYGGSEATYGSIRPGSTLYLISSIEYVTYNHIGFNCDFQLILQDKSHAFRGDPGFTKEGALAKVGLPSSLQLSVTPSIEYNLTSNCGVFCGVWATLAGKNTTAFAGVFGTLVYGF